MQVFWVSEPYLPPLSFCRSVLIGFGAVIFSLFVGKAGSFTLFTVSFWHIGLAGFLSYLLQFDLYEPLGVNKDHLIIGAAGHLVFAAIYVLLSLTSSSSKPAKAEGKGKKGN